MLPYRRIRICGHDFRPDYLRIGTLRDALGVPLAAFTATADQETREEIVERLFSGGDCQIFLKGFDRPNIHLAFAPKNKPRQQLLDFVAAHKEDDHFRQRPARRASARIERLLDPLRPVEVVWADEAG